MKKIYNQIYIILFLLISIIDNPAQVPIQFYDFELNIGELTSEIIVNPVTGSTVSSVGGGLTTVQGNPSSGSAWQRADWDENGVINPGVNASDYIEFSSSTDGFTGISVKVDASASSEFLTEGGINLLYSFDGGSTFIQSTSQNLTGSFTIFNWDLSAVTGLDNNPDIKFRLYAYGDITSMGTLTIDNLYVSAQKIIASKILGDYQLIDDANGSAPFPVFENFIVDGLDINVNLQSDLRINNSLTLTNGIIITGSNRIILEDGAGVLGANTFSYAANSFGYFYEEDGFQLESGRDVSLFFPIGSLAGYRPVTIMFDEIEDGGETGEIVITQLDENPSPASLPSSVQNISNVRYWRLTSDFNSFEDFEIRLEWSSDDGISDLENVTVVYGIAGGSWTEENNSGGTGGTINNGFVVGTFDEAQPRDFTLGNLAGGGNELPVELSSFTGRIINNNINLSWQTETEVNSFKFIVERIASENMRWINIGEVAASGNSNSYKFYSFTDKNPGSGSYSYRLKMIDNDGSFDYSNEIHFEIKGDDGFELSQNYPNPFNPSTIIKFNLPERSFVSLKIYNVLGNEITTLINEVKPEGEHSIEFDVGNLSNELSNGPYFYMLKAGDYTETRKMIYMK